MPQASELVGDLPNWPHGRCGSEDHIHLASELDAGGLTIGP